MQEDSFDPWGLTFGTTNERQTPDVLTNRFQFLGREKQEALSLNWLDLQKRYYDPSLARFLQVDPVTETQESLSLYQYGWNNPILRSDPNGDCPFCVVVFLGIITAAQPALAPSGGANAEKEKKAYDDAYKSYSTDIYSSFIPGGKQAKVSQVLFSSAKNTVKNEVKKEVAKVVTKVGDKVNGNSKASTKAQHNYDIKDTKNKDRVVKTGASGGKETKNGESYRGNSQANAWNKEAKEPGRYKSVITNRVPEGTGARQKALDYEVKRADQVRPQLDKTKHIRP